MKKSIVPLKIWVIYLTVVTLSVAAVLGMLFINIDVTVEMEGEIVSRSGPVAVAVPVSGKLEQVLITKVKKVKAGEDLAVVKTAQNVAIDLKAPEDGVLIWERELLVGEIVERGEILGVLHPVEDLVVVARLDSVNTENFYPGMPVRIRFDKMAGPHPGFKDAVMDSVVVDIFWQKTDNGLEPFARIAAPMIAGELLPGFTVQVEAMVARSSLLEGVF